jgi:hypothetical protein
MRFDVRCVLAASALLAGLALSSPVAAAADPAEGGYAITGASQSRGKYPYLTMESLTARLPKSIAAQLPPADSGRLVIVNAVFRATGGHGELRRLDPGDLQVQWTDAAGRGAAPVVGMHVSKDMITLAGARNFYTSMRSDSYELLAIVPKTARAIDLAQRQPDGSFKPVRKIGLSAAK